MDDSLAPESIKAHLATDWLGRPCFCFARVTSTMDVARKYAEEGVPDGAIVLAEAQDAGRGRLGRSWQSPPGMGIWCSVVMPSELSAGVLAHLVAHAIRAALAVHEVPALAVKWPNDVMAVAYEDSPDVLAGSPIEWPEDVCLRARKIAGVLIESVQVPRRRLVVGFGVNVHQSEDAFAPELARVATSVYAHTGRRVVRAALLASILAELECRYACARDGKPEQTSALLEEWHTYSLVCGRRVEVEMGMRRFVGRAVGIQPDGALLVESHGGRRACYTGTVRLLAGAEEPSPLERGP